MLDQLSDEIDTPEAGRLYREYVQFEQAAQEFSLATMRTDAGIAFFRSTFRIMDPDEFYDWMLNLHPDVRRAFRRRYRLGFAKWSTQENARDAKAYERLENDDAFREKIQMYIAELLAESE
jgi:hypothetical protein